MDKFIEWIKDFFATENLFFPDEQWKSEHDRINENPNIMLEPLAEASKNENES